MTFKIVEASWTVVKALIGCWIAWAVVTQDAIKINYIDNGIDRVCVCVGDENR